MRRVLLARSFRELPDQGADHGAVDEAAEICVTVELRGFSRKIDFSEPTTHESEFSNPHETISAEDRRRLVAELDSFGLRVSRWKAGGRLAVVRGQAGAFQRLTDTPLRSWEAPASRSFRAREGCLAIPGAMASLVVGIHGLDDRPQMERFEADVESEKPPPLLDFAKLHQFPAVESGVGHTDTGGVAILVCEGSFVPGDLDETMDAYKLRTPVIEEAGVLGEQNPGPARTSFETTMDVSIVATIISSVPITIFFAPRSSQGLLHALESAIWHRSRPSVITISYGNSERRFSDQSISAVNRLLRLAAEKGITVCCSAGNHGSNTRSPDGRPQVEFPGSSPWVLGCGGCIVSDSSAGPTVTALNRNGLVTGGGLSRRHLMPDWQDGAARSWEKGQDGLLVTRGVPDVCAHAVGFPFRMGGMWHTGEGTSIAAPVWAGLIARCNFILGTRLGFINPSLYSKEFEQAFTDITSGDNGRFSAIPGWDACTGLGMPIGTELLQAFRTQLGIKVE